MRLMLFLVMKYQLKLLERKKKESSNVDIESKISKLEARKDKLYQLLNYHLALEEIRFIVCGISIEVIYSQS